MESIIYSKINDLAKMSVENFNEIELNLDLSYINCSTTALIREYLARKVIYNFQAK